MGIDNNFLYFLAESTKSGAGLPIRRRWSSNSVTFAVLTGTRKTHVRLSYAVLSAHQ
jgi:NADH:ubiquinone oxidoreductase subunit H